MKRRNLVLAAVGAVCAGGGAAAWWWQQRGSAAAPALAATQPPVGAPPEGQTPPSEATQQQASASAAPPRSEAPAAAPAPALSVGQLQAGRDYRLLAAAQPTDAPAGKVAVIEFFGYWCPHCSEFEPSFERWVQAHGNRIAVQRVPLAFAPETVPMQRLYFALDMLGKVDAMQAKVFAAVHQQGVRLITDEAVLAWAAAQPELAGDAFVKAYRAFGMNALLRQASQLGEAYAVEGVPALGVAGRYYVDGTLAGGMARALDIAAALAQQAPRAQG